MVWSASSDFWKAPSVKALSANTLLSEEKSLINDGQSTSDKDIESLLSMTTLQGLKFLKRGVSSPLPSHPHIFIMSVFSFTQFLSSQSQFCSCLLSIFRFSSFALFNKLILPTEHYFYFCIQDIYTYKQTDGTGLNLEHLMLLRVSCLLLGNHQATEKTSTLIYITLNSHRVVTLSRKALVSGCCQTYPCTTVQFSPYYIIRYVCSTCTKLINVVYNVWI